jgi:AAT family amino acid transporter
MEAKPSPGINYPLGIASFAGLSVLNIAAWYLLFNPTGVLRLYTPMYGFAMVVILLAMLVTVTELFDCRPLRPESGGRLSPLQGAALTVFSVLLAWGVMFGLFHNLIGRFGISYFSPAAIVATRETGTEIFNARENSSTALIYLFAAYIWIAIAWKNSFRAWPWNGQSRATLGFSRLMTVTVFSALAYALLFHPHVGYLFSPPQKLAAVAPWWEAWADTNSAYFHLGWVVCTVAVLIVTESLWEGYPWRILRKEEGSLAGGLFSFLGSLCSGLLLMYVMKKAMDLYWGAPIVGGQYLDAPYFRYLHAAEMAGFLILASYLVSIYLGNLFSSGNLWLAGSVRTAAALLLAGLLMWFYYAAGPSLLGTVPGIGQPEDTPLCWTFFMISFVLMHRHFFNAAPVRVRL